MCLAASTPRGAPTRRFSRSEAGMGPRVERVRDHVGRRLGELGRRITQPHSAERRVQAADIDRAAQALIDIIPVTWLLFKYVAGRCGLKVKGST